MLTAAAEAVTSVISSYRLAGCHM